MRTYIVRSTCPRPAVTAPVMSLVTVDFPHPLSPTSAYVIRQHTSAYVSVRQRNESSDMRLPAPALTCNVNVSVCQHPSASVSIRQHKESGDRGLLSPTSATVAPRLMVRSNPDNTLLSVREPPPRRPPARTPLPLATPATFAPTAGERAAAVYAKCTPVNSYGSMRQDTSGYVSAYAKSTPVNSYFSIRQHTSAYVSRMRFRRVCQVTCISIPRAAE